MKKFFLPIFLLLSMHSMAQDNTIAPVESQNLKHFFYLSPFHLFASTYEVGYEYAASPKASLLLIGGVTLKRNKDEEKTGFNTELHCRLKIYLSNKTNSQTLYYFSPFLQYLYLQEKENFIYTYPYITSMASNTTRSFGGGTLFGIRTGIYQKFMVDIYAGGGIKYGQVIGFNANDNFDIFSPGFTGVFPKVGLLIGVAF